jgi:hypothetical protein
MEMVLQDWKDEKTNSFYFDSNIACLKKVQDPDNVYSQLIIHLLNRMLKVMRLILNHDIGIENNLLGVFRKITETSELLTDSFALTKERIKDVELDLKVQSITLIQ